MRMASRVGLRSPLYCTGVGKAILATLPDDEVAEIWRHSRPQKLTGRTVASLDALAAQLADVRRSGYAIDDEENELGVRCVALAIPGPGGRAESAFSISGLAPLHDRRPHPPHQRPGAGNPGRHFAGDGAERVSSPLQGRPGRIDNPFPAAYTES